MSKLSVYEQLRSEILDGKWNVCKILEEVEHNNISNSESFHLQTLISAQQRKAKYLNS